jgi:hypothetical protein
MSEILTESFCERCGTRYTFESGVPGRSVMGGVRLHAKGLRSFATGRRSTFQEAMADARGEVLASATAQQLDAFHEAFSFCLGCRQYTCRECWNEPAGRCRTCVPLPGQERRDLLVAIASVVAPNTPEPVAAEAVVAEVAVAEVAAAAPESAVVAPEPAGSPAEPGPVTAGTAAAEEVTWPASRPTRPSTGARRAVVGLPPGLSVEQAVASYEAMLAEQEASIETAAASETVETVPAPIAVPEPIAAAALPVEELPPVAQEPSGDVWRTVAPDDETPRWPTARPWPRGRTDLRPPAIPGPSPEPVMPAVDVSAMWAASAQQVISAGPTSGPASATVDGQVATRTAGGAHLCDRCGLALSANARFCRRCGLPQP